MDSAEVGVLAALKKAFSEIADVSAKGTADKQQQENEKLRAILLAVADRFGDIGRTYVQLGAEVQSALIELEPSLISFPEQPEHEPGDVALAEDLGFTPGDIGYEHKLRLIADFRKIVIADAEGRRQDMRDALDEVLAMVPGQQQEINRIMRRHGL